MPIDWYAFDWQSFATLATGFIAVGAAFYVGRKQAAISAAQTEILARQTRLAELTLRHEIFDRRYEVFVSAQNFLSQTLRHGEAPNLAESQPFLEAMWKSRLLFQPRVYEGLKRIWGTVGDYRTAKQSVIASDGSKESLDKEHQLFLTINDEMIRVLDLFGDEIRLGD